MPRTELAADANFYLSAYGTDAAGNGLSPSTPAKTRKWLWDMLVCDYDLRGFRAIINMAPGVYTDDFFAQGRIPGTRSLGQIAPYGQAPVSLDRTKQIVFRGDVANPLNVVSKPVSGPSFFAENGACFYVEGIAFDHSSASHWESVTGATHGSTLMLGKNIFGPAPGQVDIQIGVGAQCFIFDSYDIDHKLGGTYGGIAVQAALGPATGYMGLSAPNAGIVVGIPVNGPGIAPGTTVSSYNGICDVWLSQPQQYNVGLGSYTFGSGGFGPTTFHIQQDLGSMVHYETDDPNTPHITVTAKNSPAYGVLIGNGGGDTVLREGPQIPGVTFKGSLGAQAMVSRERNGYVFNYPNDNNVVFVP